MDELLARLAELDAREVCHGCLMECRKSLHGTNYYPCDRETRRGLDRVSYPQVYEWDYDKGRKRWTRRR